MIAEDTIVGLASFVRGQFTTPSTILAGVPAKAVRGKRSWARKDRVNAKQTDIYAWRSLPLL